MKLSGTKIRLTAAALGVVALFAAGAAAGVNRGEDMRSTGLTDHSPDMTTMTRLADEQRRRL